MKYGTWVGKEESICVCKLYANAAASCWTLFICASVLLTHFGWCSVKISHQKLERKLHKRAPGAVRIRLRKRQIPLCSCFFGLERRLGTHFPNARVPLFADANPKVHSQNVENNTSPRRQAFASWASVRHVVQHNARVYFHLSILLARNHHGLGFVSWSTSLFRRGDTHDGIDWTHREFKGWRQRRRDAA